jgi:hypothetical protein
VPVHDLSVLPGFGCGHGSFVVAIHVAVAVNDHEDDHDHE